MPETSIAPPLASRSSKPVSEALLNEKVSSALTSNPIFWALIEAWAVRCIGE